MRSLLPPTAVRRRQRTVRPLCQRADTFFVTWLVPRGEARGFTGRRYGIGYGEGRLCPQNFFWKWLTYQQRNPNFKPWSRGLFNFGNHISHESEDFVAYWQLPHQELSISYWPYILGMGYPKNITGFVQIPHRPMAIEANGGRSMIGARTWVEWGPGQCELVGGLRHSYRTVRDSSRPDVRRDFPLRPATRPAWTCAGSVYTYQQSVGTRHVGAHRRVDHSNLATCEEHQQACWFV